MSILLGIGYDRKKTSYKIEIVCENKESGCLDVKDIV